MKKLLASLQWLALASVVFISLFSGLKDDYEVRQILEEADIASAQITLSNNQSSEQVGYVDSKLGEWRFTTNQLQKKIHELPSLRRHHFYTWSAQDRQEVTGSASGVDKLAYFANSFLIGFKPFETTSVWQPLATLALRKNYVLDHVLYGPSMAEIWQNSKQAYKYTRGDCEDHAIILADWLIAMGHDARVVLGKYNGGGHAWVVLFKDGREYVLEATSKQRPRGLKDLQLARLATDYLPLYQFDRKNFWVNSGSVYTTKYRDSKWQLRSTFTRSG